MSKKHREEEELPFVELMDTMTNVVGVLIIVHEAGHYLVALRSGMRVRAFSIGFGPSLATIFRNGTEFRIGVEQVRSNDSASGKA